MLRGDPLIPVATEFDWDEANVEHIARHNVSPEEAEQAYADPKRINCGTRRVGQESRGIILGRTDAGRILFLVFTKREGAIRIFSVREATQDEKKRYRKR